MSKIKRRIRVHHQKFIAPTVAILAKFHRHFNIKNINKQLLTTELLISG